MTRLWIWNRNCKLNVIVWPNQPFAFNLDFCNTCLYDIMEYIRGTHVTLSLRKQAVDFVISFTSGEPFSLGIIRDLPQLGLLKSNLVVEIGYYLWIVGLSSHKYFRFMYVLYLCSVKYEVLMLSKIKFLLENCESPLRLIIFSFYYSSQNYC